MATTPRSTLVTKAQELMKSQGLDYATAAKQARASVTPTPTPTAPTTPTTTTTPVTPTPEPTGGLTTQEALKATKGMALDERRLAMGAIKTEPVKDLTPPSPTTTQTQAPITPAPTQTNVTPTPTQTESDINKKYGGFIQDNGINSVQPAQITTTPVKTETPKAPEIPVDRTSQINANLTEGFNNNPSLFEDREAFNKAYNYDTKPPEEQAVLDSFFNSKKPTINSYYDQLVAGTVNPAKRNDPSYRVANIRYNKMKVFSGMNQSELKNSLTKGDIVEGSQEWEDLKKVNPKLAQDALNLLKVNGNKVDIFTTDESGNKVNNLEKNATETWMTAFADLFKVQTLEEIRNEVQTPDFKAAQSKANEYAQELDDLQTQLDTIEDDVKAEYEGTGATSSKIQMEIAKREKEIRKQYDSVNRKYTTQFNVANQILTQNTADIATRNQQKQAQNNALAGLMQAKYQQQLGLETEQAKFDQQIANQAKLLNDPQTAISSVMQEYKALGVPFIESLQTKVQKANDYIKNGGTLSGYIDQMIKDAQAKPEYKAKQAYEMAQLTQKPTTPYQLANLGDGRAIMYNQSTGEYQQINASAVQTASQSPETIAQYSQNVRGKTNLQCGELVNDYWNQFTGSKAGMGDTLKSKMDAISKIGISMTPQVGGVFVLDTGTSTGHTGIVTGVNGNQITVLEANRAGKSTGEQPTQAIYTISPKFAFSNPPAQQASGTQYTDQNISDLAYIVELQDKNPTQAAKDMKELGYTARDVANYKSGNVPLTDKQKMLSSEVMNEITDLLTNYDYTDATGVHFFNEAPRGSDWADAEEKIKTIVSKLTLPNLGVLKGPMSDKDLAFIQAASSNLAINQSDTSFAKQIVKAYNLAARRAGVKEVSNIDEIKQNNRTAQALLEWNK